MKLKAQNISRRMGATSSSQPHQSRAGSPTVVETAVINTVVRRLGLVAIRTFEVIQGNLISAGKHELAEALNDMLKPLCDALLHFDISEDVTEVDNAPVP